MALDCVSLERETDRGLLPSYYDTKEFLIITSICLAVYLIFFVAGIVVFVGEIIIMLLCTLHEYFAQFLSVWSHYREEGFMKWAKEKRAKRIALLSLLFAESAFLSLASHFPSIIMAWATDPFYASKIALFYGIVIFSYFTAFHYSYIVTRKACTKEENGKIVIKTLSFCGYLALLFIASVLCVSGVIIIITLFVINVPVNNSIETVSDGVTTIYNGVVVLVGGLVAYRIGWYYLGHSFSISDALQKTLQKMNKPSFMDDSETWMRLTEEGRLIEVMEAIVNGKSALPCKIQND
jgi:hypothetical protein